MEDERPIVGAIARRLAWERASEKAASQSWTIARWQLLDMGCSSDQIRHWLAIGRLHPVHPGVYALGRPELTPEGETAAALLHAGHGAALAGTSALWWLGLLHRRPVPTQVATPSRARTRPGVSVLHRNPLPRHFHRGLPVVPLAEAMLAATQQLSHDSLRLVLARAEFARLLDRRSLEGLIRSRRPGCLALRAAVDAHLPQLARCVNGFERDFVLLCERFRLPLPEPNARIGRYRPDMLWSEAMLIVELDGEGAHSTPAQLRRDRQRQAELEQQGYTVIRFTWEEVHREPVRVAAAVRRRLSQLEGS